MNVFDIIENISSNNEFVFSEEEVEQYYNPYVVLDYFSKFEDTVFIANELNSFKTSLSKYDHYLYLYTTIRKKTRKYRNIKKDVKKEENVKIIMQYFDCGRESAIREILPLVTDINIQDMKKYLTDFGGVQS